MSKSIDITKQDLYGILDLDLTATEKQIVKAYRKKALKWHPDKNPNNNYAVEQFYLITKALEILTDAAARAAFDKVIRGKQAAATRNQELNAKRKKLKEDLEARESRASEHRVSDVSAAQKLAAEIERLRKEGSKLLEDEKQRLAEELKKDTTDKNEVKEEGTSQTHARLKLKWKAKKSDEENGGYNHEFLHSALSKYGDLSILLVSSKKNGSAIAEFVSCHDAYRAVQIELGKPENPLSFTWLSGEPSQTAAPTAHVKEPTTTAVHANAPTPHQQNSTNLTTDNDFESLVFMRMRQAEERRKLIEEMAKEDELENDKK